MPVELPARGVARDARIRRRLLAWYRRHRRDLPWRGTRDPYAIWVSEIMLQQTQVETVRPFYLRFLDRFPTIERLARAPASAVLARWAGLGYYRRARHLHAAAKLVMREHAGRVPDDAAAFARLPGVGRYTTGAVLSIAFDRPLPVLDGNVARVLSRLDAVRAAVRDPRGAERLWARAQALVPARRPGDWNQALMELGATVCLPATPRCDACPLRAECRALAIHRVASYPPTAARRATVVVKRAVALVTRRGRMLVVRREGRALEGLWEPPAVDLADGVTARCALGAELHRLGVTARLARTGQVVRHTITHHRIEAEVWRGELTGKAPRSARVRFVDPARPGVALTAMAARVARVLAGGKKERM